LLCIASAALRLSVIKRPLSYDESFTYLEFGRGSLWNAIRKYSHPNNHLFHTVCLWVSTHLFGLSVVALRLPVLLFGIALVPLSYLLAREVTSRGGSLLAAALVGGSDLLVTYSADARGYGVQAALFVTTLLIVPGLVRRPSMTLAAAFAVTLSLALLTVPTLVYGVPVPFVWGASLARAEGSDLRRRLAWLAAAGAIAALLTVICYVPAILYVLYGGFHWGQPVEPRAPLAFLGDIVAYFVNGLPRALGLGVLVIVALGALLEGWSEKKLPLAATWIGIPAAALSLHMAVASRPPFTRSFVFVAPLLFVLCGRSASAAAAIAPPLPGRITGRAAPLAAAVVFLWAAANTRAREYALVRSGRNTRYLLEHVVRPLQPDDEFAASRDLLLPIILYGKMRGVPLTWPRGSWTMSSVRRMSLGDKKSARSESVPSRFLLLAQSPGDRDRLPHDMQDRLLRGPYSWVERKRFPSDDGQSPTIWELLRSSRALEGE
jgi:hypothetical protein